MTGRSRPFSSAEAGSSTPEAFDFSLRLPQSVDEKHIARAMTEDGEADAKKLPEKLKRSIRRSARFIAGLVEDKRLMQLLEREIFVGNKHATAVLKQLKRLVSVSHLRGMADLLRVEPCAVSIVGPVNVGKSTLLNTLAGEKLAEVSAIPGTTTEPHSYEAMGFVLIDTPGADELSGETRRELALASVDESGITVFLLDATRGVNTSDKAVFDAVVSRILAKERADLDGLAKGEAYTLKGLVTRRRLIVGLNKLDAVPRAERDQVKRRASIDIGLGDETVIGISALKRRGLDEMARRMVDGAPAMAEALAEAMPAYSNQLAAQLILRYSTAAATVALTPIPFSHVIPLTVLQLALVIRLARLYGHDLSWKRSREVVPAIAAGIGWREVFRQVVKLIPVAGWAINSGFAFAGTYATGKAAQYMLKTGKKPSEDQVETWKNEGRERR